MRPRKTYRVVSDYCGTTALAGYRHTLRGARVLLEQVLRGPGAKVRLRIELLVNEGKLTDGWQMVEQTTLPGRAE